MKAAVAVGILLLATNAAGIVWAVGALHKQGCQIDNLRTLEVVRVASDRVAVDGTEPLTLRAQYPGARPCKWGSR